MTPVTRLDLAPHGHLDRMRLAAEILVAYGHARWAMRGGDAEVGVRRIRSWARRHQVPDASGAQVLAGWRLGNAVSRTIAPLPADSRCLFRSLTLLRVMERRGLSATLVIAVRPQPFAAHAWVELYGTPLLPCADPGFERIAEM